MPSFNSAAVWAFTKRPRPLTAACQRSSTPELSGLLTVGYGCGHCTEPAASRFSVSDWLAIGSLPCVPSESAAKFRCCHVAGSLLVAGTLSVASGPEGRRSVAQKAIEWSDAAL